MEIEPYYGNRKARALAAGTALRIAAVIDDPVDIVNAMLGKLQRERIELPAYSTLDRLADRAHAAADHRLFSWVMRHLAEDQTVSPIDGTTPTGMAPGTSSGSQSFSSFEHYSSFNGTLNPVIPLYHVGGRGEAGVDLVWNLQQTWVAAKRYGGSSPFIPIDPYPNSNIAGPQGGVGVLLGAGAVFSRTGSNFISCPSGGSAPGSTVTHIVFETSNGTQMELIDSNTKGIPYNIPSACNRSANTVDAGRGTVFQSNDGSSMQFTADSTVLDTVSYAFGEADSTISGFLRLSNGITYRIDNSTVSWIRDRNGNEITFQYNSGQQTYVTWYLPVAVPSQITDSQGRITTINYNDSSCNGCITINYPGFGGVARAVQIVLAHLSAGLLRPDCPLHTIDQLFPGTGQPTSYNFDPILPQYVQYPDGSRYSFTYDSYGELARVILPTGGAVEYNYGDGHNVANYFAGPRQAMVLRAFPATIIRS